MRDRIPYSEAITMLSNVGFHVEREGMLSLQVREEPNSRPMRLNILDGTINKVNFEKVMQRRRVERENGMVDLKVIFQFRRETRHQDAGWYWHYQAMSPQNEPLCGVIKGPFDTLEAASADNAAKELAP